MTRHDDTHIEAIGSLLSIRLKEIPVRRNKNKIACALKWPQDSRPHKPGVYAFWWREGLKDLFGQIKNRTLSFHGPGGANAETIRLNLGKHDFSECGGMVPLYIGKTYQPISKRIGQHLMLDSERHIPLGEGHALHERANTSCQVKDRLERLFHETKDVRDLMVKNLALSWVEMDCWKRRFFFEDYAIGYYRPLFNLDCER